MNRRTFLKISAVLGAAVARVPPGLALASSLPLPWPHRYFGNPARLLRADLTRYDLLLVPAYTAAELIRARALKPVAGPPQRPHDPEGVFTIPYAWVAAAPVRRHGQPASMNDVWSREAGWPRDPRVVIGAALLRRGYSPNDTHPGHLAQVEGDLRALRPSRVRNPAVALSLVPLGAGEVRWPGNALFATEYDWVVPAASPRATEARAFAADQRLMAGQTVLAGGRTLAPLPLAVQARQAALWRRLPAELTHSDLG